MRSDQLKCTYIGGPTALFELNGLRLLTDPTFDPAGEEYPTGVYTLRKTAGPALGPESLGRIDAVLLSHDHHHDNLDRGGRLLLNRLLKARRERRFVLAGASPAWGVVGTPQ